MFELLIGGWNARDDLNDTSYSARLHGLALGMEPGRQAHETVIFAQAGSMFRCFGFGSCIPTIPRYP